MYVCVMLLHFSQWEVVLVLVWSGVLPSWTGPSVHSCSVFLCLMLLNFDCCSHGLPSTLLGTVLISYLQKVTGVNFRMLKKKKVPYSIFFCTFMRFVMWSGSVKPIRNSWADLAQQSIMRDKWGSRQLWPWTNREMKEDHLLSRIYCHYIRW